MNLRSWIELTDARSTSFFGDDPPVSPGTDPSCKDYFPKSANDAVSKEPKTAHPFHNYRRELSVANSPNIPSINQDPPTPPICPIPPLAPQNPLYTPPGPAPLTHRALVPSSPLGQQ